MPKPLRCPHVPAAGRRAGRARPDAGGATPGARGSAAGSLRAMRPSASGKRAGASSLHGAGAARRSARSPRARRPRPERLLMVDYQQRAVRRRSACPTQRRSSPPSAAGSAHAGPAPASWRHRPSRRWIRVPPRWSVVFLLPVRPAGRVVVVRRLLGRPGRGARGLPDAAAAAASPPMIVLYVGSASPCRRRDRQPRGGRGRRRPAPERRASATEARGGQDALPQQLRQLPQPRRGQRPRRHRPGSRRDRRGHARARSSTRSRTAAPGRSACRPACSRARRPTRGRTCPRSPAR